MSAASVASTRMCSAARSSRPHPCGDGAAFSGGNGELRARGSEVVLGGVQLGVEAGCGGHELGFASRKALDARIDLPQRRDGMNCGAACRFYFVRIRCDPLCRRRSLRSLGTLLATRGRIAWRWLAAPSRCARKSCVSWGRSMGESRYWPMGRGEWGECGRACPCPCRWRRRRRRRTWHCAGGVGRT